MPLISMLQLKSEVNEKVDNVGNTLSTCGPRFEYTAQAGFKIQSASIWSL